MQNLRKILENSFVADLEHHATIGSTNDRAVECAASEKVKLPLLILADRQTAGRRARRQPLVDRAGKPRLQPVDWAGSGRRGTPAFALGLAGHWGGDCGGRGPPAAGP